MADEYKVAITQKRRPLLGRLRIFPRAFRFFPVVFELPTRRRLLWRVLGAWFIAGIQFYVDGVPMEVF